MAKVTKFKITIDSTIATAQFENIKPKVEFEFEIEEGEKATKIMEEYYETLTKLMYTKNEKIKKDLGLHR